MEYINDLLKVEVQDYVALVTIDHPPLNILTLKLSAQIPFTAWRRTMRSGWWCFAGQGKRHSVWERISRSFHRCGMM